MKRIIFFFAFMLVIQSCGLVNMQRMRARTQAIKLQSINTSQSLQVYNEKVKIYLAFSDVIKEAESEKQINSNKKFKEFLIENNEPILLVNNLQLKGTNEVILFDIVWELLKEGKATIKYLDNNTIDVIELVKISDFSGKQEYFKVKGGDIFLSRILSIGE